MRGKSTVYLPSRGVEFQSHKKCAVPNWSRIVLLINAKIPVTPAEMKTFTEIEFKRWYKYMTAVMAIIHVNTKLKGAEGITGRSGRR